MKEEKNIFKNNKKLKEIDILTENLIGNEKNIENKNIKNNFINEKIKIIPKQNKEKRVHINLTILPKKIIKIKNIAKKNGISVSSLLEQIIDQL